MLGKNQVAGSVAGLTAKDATKASDIIARLKQVANVKTDTELASVLGLKQSSVSTARTNGIVPPSWVINATKLFNKSADWLIFGGDKVPFAAPLSPNMPAKLNDETEKYARIPLVETELATGGGSFVDSQSIVKYIEITYDLIKFKGPLKNLAFMSVTGDSMEPTLAHKDLVLINLSQTTPYSGGVFALAHDYGVYIKRLILEPGKLILRSDNSYYKDIALDLRDEAVMSLVKIIGQAVWWCHEENI